ncbi:MAG TPA: 3-deoxy-7-phosphoheptulonate synthase, partial [Candidatus Rokubacteria bacterium]|nr:3-deoxy-7-phosphoheptulonate synthase [Candidatus Rokubacteria bacterium]
GPRAARDASIFVARWEGVKAAGAHVLRGGAFKPRTSPYAFQGLEDEGLKLLAEARRETGLPVVTEVMTADKVD